MVSDKKLRHIWRSRAILAGWKWQAYPRPILTRFERLPLCVFCGRVRECPEPKLLRLVVSCVFVAVQWVFASINSVSTAPRRLKRKLLGLEFPFACGHFHAVWTILDDLVACPWIIFSFILLVDVSQIEVYCENGGRVMDRKKSVGILSISKKNSTIFWPISITTYYFITF